MAPLLELSEQEYLEIEETLASNARGRAFLRHRDSRVRIVTRGELRQVMGEVLGAHEPATEQRGGADIRLLHEELLELRDYMNRTRREIAALRPADMGTNRIIAATGELDAIVSATERATSEILSGAEHIQALVDQLPRDGDTGVLAREISARVTDVLTACSFQDITGQRTTKVVNTLRYIEQRINSMIEIWGGEEAESAVEPLAIDIGDRRPDAALMNGPALDGGPSQSDIDTLFDALDMGGAGDVPAAVATTSSQSEIDALFA